MAATYSLRVREDGQTEVVEHSAVVLGTFVRPEHARQFYDWMAGSHLTVRRAPEPEVAPAAPAANAPAASAFVPEPMTIRRLSVPVLVAEQQEVPVRPAQRRQAGRDKAVPPVVVDDGEGAPENLPAAPARAVVERPRQAVTMCAHLPEEVMAPAFERLERGERLQVVASELGVPWPSLRGAYAGYKGRRQREIARGGMSSCSLCSREFMPSVTSPDTCARCAKAMGR